MIHDTKFKSINTSEILVNNDWCLHFENNLPKELESSFDNVGVLHPPLALQRDNCYELICGHRRFHYLQEHKANAVTCKIVSKDLSSLELLNITLEDQLLSAPLSLVEKARFIEIARKYLDDTTILVNFSKRLSIRKHKSAITELLTILKFDKFILELIQNNTLSEQTSHTLCQLEQKDQTILAQLIDVLKPGSGKQKRLITLLLDISGKNNVSIEKYLEKEEIQEILKHEQMNSPQKVQQLTEYLQKENSPKLEEAKQDFKALLKEIDLPSTATLTPSLSFEKDEVFLTVKFRNIDEAKEKWKKIKKYI